MPNPAKGPARKARLESLLRREIATTVQQVVDNPACGFLTVTRVVMTGDLQQVTAYWTCIGTPAQRARAAKVLDQQRGQIQTAYAGAVHTRLLPILHFKYDEGEEARGKMDVLIRQARTTDTDRGANPETPAEAPKPD
jgi:ribosome-binding factor A